MTPDTSVRPVVNTQFGPPALPPKNWLVENILVTILCCNILGVIGIYFAAQVDGNFYKGDLAAAQSNANTAKWMALVSFLLGGGLILIVVIFYGAAILAISQNGTYQ